MPEPILGSAEDLEAGRVEPPDRKVAEDATVSGNAQRVADAPGCQIVDSSRRQRRDQLVRARAFNSDPRHETEIKQSRRRTAAHGLGANVAIVRAQRPNVETAIHHGWTRVWPDRTTTMTPARTRATSRARRTAGTACATRAPAADPNAALWRSTPAEVRPGTGKTPPIPMPPINTPATSAIATITIIGRTSEKKVRRRSALIAITNSFL